MACSKGCCATQAEHYRSITTVSQLTKDRVVSGKAHPDSGLPFKAVTNEAGTVTEHSGPGRASGVSERQDVLITPQAVNLTIGTS